MERRKSHRTERWRDAERGRRGNKQHVSEEGWGEIRSRSEGLGSVFFSREASVCEKRCVVVEFRVKAFVTHTELISRTERGDTDRTLSK